MCYSAKGEKKRLLTETGKGNLLYCTEAYSKTVLYLQVEYEFQIHVINKEGCWVRMSCHHAIKSYVLLYLVAQRVICRFTVTFESKQMNQKQSSVL